MEFFVEYMRTNVQCKLLSLLDLILFVQ